MADIIINAQEFQCESPNVGDIYRNISSNSHYIFNWTTQGNVYTSYGKMVNIKLYYKLEEQPPEYEYTDTVLPFNAINLDLGQFNADLTSFRLEFIVDDGNTCYYSIDIPYSTIILI